MNDAAVSAPIVMAEDDEDYYMLARTALHRAQVPNDLVWVEDGEECLDYLLGKGRFAGRTPRRPGIVLLDLNMPRKNGHETLSAIKADPQLCSIPVVILTVSESEDDVRRSYELGASSFVNKPLGFAELVALLRSLRQYWFETVRLALAERGPSQA